MNNHIFLMNDYIQRLLALNRAQNWVDKASAVTTNKKAQKTLVKYQENIIAEKIRLQDEMLEISRSN